MALKSLYISCLPSHKFASELFHSKQKWSRYDNVTEFIQNFEVREASLRAEGVWAAAAAEGGRGRRVEGGGHV